MELIEIIENLTSFEDGSTIYAAEPWSETSQAIVGPEPESGDLPAEAERLGLEYFLEVFLARDFLDGWVLHLEVEPTLREKCLRLVQYAITDA